MLPHEQISSGMSSLPHLMVSTKGISLPLRTSNKSSMLSRPPWVTPFKASPVSGLHLPGGLVTSHSALRILVIKGSQRLRSD